MNAALRIIPDYFTDQRIRYRIPYTMPGELSLSASQSGVQFPEATFLHNVDKPFEIWRMLVRLTAFDNASPALLVPVQPQTLRERVRLSILDTSKNERLTKNPQLISSLMKENEESWEWEVPYTFVRQEGFQVACDSLLLPVYCAPNTAGCAADTAITIGSVRVEVTFQGYLLILANPSETR